MTREEAIKLVKRIKGAMVYTEEEKEALETLIPELCENEDEKFRKYIIKCCEECIETNDKGLELSMSTTKRLVAYLKKEKDASKAIEAVDRIDKYIDENVANAHDMKDSNPDKKYYCGWDAALGKMAGILQDVYSDEKQKEQKQWSEEDERMLSRCIKSVECSKQFADSESYKVAKDVEMNWLKSLPERFVLQPKQEWSKEDEDFINMLILHFNYLVNKGGDSVETYKSYIEGLKSLPPKPHTVSIKNANKFAGLEYERGVKDGIQSEKKRHWKPSEKQLIALRYYLNHVPYSPHKEHLSSLRDDCEKLFFQ